MSASIETVLQLIRPQIRALKAYRSARSLGLKGSVFLDANESPWEPLADSGVERLNRYPEPQPSSLVSRLAALYRVDPARLLVGRGADEAIDVLVRTFCEAGKDAILICPPTYGMYEVAAHIQGAGVVECPVFAEEGFRVDPARVLAAWNPSVKLVFLCSPNNPTGNLIPREDVEAICRGLEGKAVVVLDEAYIEFSAIPGMSEAAEAFSNLVILRTLSKAWGLAGARCGVAIGAPELIAVLQKVRAPYPLSAPATALVLRALGDSDKTCGANVARLQAGRAWLVERLETHALVEQVYPSEANFILIKTRSSQRFLSACLGAGVVVRDRSSESGLADCVRISVGSEEENKSLMEALNGLE